MCPLIVRAAAGKGKRTGKDSKSEVIERLRQERLEREAAEVRRQQQVIRHAAAAARQGEAEGRRYHSGFGVGQRPPPALHRR